MNVRKHLALLILVLLVLSPVVPAQEPAAEAPAATKAPELDIMKVSPEELVGADVSALVGKAHAAYNEKRYEDAAPHLETIVADYPEAGADPVALLLRCYEEMGREADAEKMRKKLEEMRGGR